jgi:hypothetical protein
MAGALNRKKLRISIMLEGLEKIGTEHKRTAWDKVVIALSTLVLALLTFEFVFEPEAIVQPHEHRILNLISRLAVMAMCAAILTREVAKRRHPNKPFSSKV